MPNAEVGEGAAQVGVQSRPYLQIAVFCEKVLRETDSVVSLIRVVDKVIHTRRGPSAPEIMPEMAVQLTGMLAFKSTVAAEHDLRVEMIAPSGRRLGDPQTLKLKFDGPAAPYGVMLDVTLGIESAETGTHWWEIYMDDALLTRVPLSIEYRREVTTAAS